MYEKQKDEYYFQVSVKLIEMNKIAEGMYLEL